MQRIMDSLDPNQLNKLSIKLQFNGGMPRMNFGLRNFTKLPMAHLDMNLKDIGLLPKSVTYLSVFSAINLPNSTDDDIDNISVWNKLDAMPLRKLRFRGNHTDFNTTNKQHNFAAALPLIEDLEISQFLLHAILLLHCILSALIFLANHPQLRTLYVKALNLNVLMSVWKVAEFASR